MTTEIVHRYTCTIHDGENCDGHCVPSVATLISWYAEPIALVTEKAPATTLADFAEQISTASCRMYDAGINEAEDLESASIYLFEADEVTGPEQDFWLKKASNLLNGVTYLIDEYRDMV